METMRELGYLPHGAARALASNRSFTIGAIVPTVDDAIFSTSINALGDRLAAANYTLLLAVSNYSQEAEIKQVRLLLERGIDGLMLIGNDHAQEVYEALDRVGKPYVNTWTYDPESGHPNVGFSNTVAMVDVARHLAGLGHVDIGMLAGITAGNDRARGRLEGLREALANEGLTLARQSTEEIPYSIPIARQVFARMVEEGRLPTALVCGNDVIALGVLFEAQQRGIRIPDDLSVVGFDDMPVVAHVQPSLTTVHIQSDRMGAAAGEALLEALRGGGEVRSRPFETQLKVRETTGPPGKLRSP